MLSRPDMPLWMQVILFVTPIVLVLVISYYVITLSADVTDEFRRARARAWAKTQAVLRADLQGPSDLEDLMSQPIGPLRLQQQRVKGWRTPDDAARVSRGTDWANPWRVGDLVALPGFDGSIRVTPQIAVELFAAWVTERGWVEQMTEELAGRDLVCWCKIGTPCHADWILETVNRLDYVIHLYEPSDQLSAIDDVHKHLTRTVSRF